MYSLDQIMANMAASPYFNLQPLSEENYAALVAQENAKTQEALRILAQQDPKGFSRLLASGWQPTPFPEVSEAKYGKLSPETAALLRSMNVNLYSKLPGGWSGNQLASAKSGLTSATEMANRGDSLFSQAVKYGLPIAGMLSGQPWLAAAGGAASGAAQGGTLLDLAKGGALTYGLSNLVSNIPGIPKQAISPITSGVKTLASGGTFEDAAKSGVLGYASGTVNPAINEFMKGVFTPSSGNFGETNMGWDDFFSSDSWDSPMESSDYWNSVGLGQEEDMSSADYWNSVGLGSEGDMSASDYWTQAGLPFPESGTFPGADLSQYTSSSSPDYLTMLAKYLMGKVAGSTGGTRTKQLPAADILASLLGYGTGSNLSDKMLDEAKRQFNVIQAGEYMPKSARLPWQEQAFRVATNPMAAPFSGDLYRQAISEAERLASSRGMNWAGGTPAEVSTYAMSKLAPHVTNYLQSIAPFTGAQFGPQGASAANAYSSLALPGFEGRRAAYGDLGVGLGQGANAVGNAYSKPGEFLSNLAKEMFTF